MLAAMAALALTLCLGWSAPAPLGDAPLTLTGMAGVAGLGLLAYLFARLTVLPLGDPVAAALAAAIIPAAMLPGIGAQALILPCSLAIWLGWRRPEQRLVALLVQCGALTSLAGLAPAGVPDGFIPATILGFAWFQMVNGLSGAANDNPQMERVERSSGDSPLMQTRSYASSAPTPESGSGEYGNV